MSKKAQRFFYILAPVVVLLGILYVTRTSQTEQCKGGQCPTYINENQVNVYLNDNYGDQWYGPGFYFGIWFTSIYAYQTWRYHHRDYPSNRHYYNHDHPVHYHGRDGGGHGNEGGRGGHDGGHREGGNRGGGGHGGGGNRGGGHGGGRSGGGGGHGGGGHR